ncbi:MAG: polysaccharide biosynthesis protein [Bacteroidia bacterium]|nr:polysaccharide biosynthesis protein [Bacteroidia bacterium]MBT8276147.1 polysaccharide biosynthesis protein [Bacteroidia bacterium]NNF32443.1 polysaccharide biosynthesis protein [Flavobacteriaceae bacterium]NNK71494.1 polysaccharide biosynthesis protein [Flavobacteriaceae bacterium]NNM08990.1 polysaccharide biosynthesis protein [Flavobacteriaceae bacterium]
MTERKKIFITGGAGFLGKHLVAHFYDDYDITIYSRDEAKHYFIKKQFPEINCIIGDVANFDLMNRSAQGHHLGIFAASLKQIEAVDQNVEVSINTIVTGALNSRKVAEDNNFEAACFISSDKSRGATTLYGAMKFVGGEAFIVNAERSNVLLSTAIYGNVLNSTGSIIPLIWDSIRNNYSLVLYSEEMTRFMIESAEAIEVIENCLKVSGYNVIPNLKSFLVKDLFEIYESRFGLKYTVGRPRISEKIHEIMIAKEEIPRTHYNAEDNSFYMHYHNLADTSVEIEEFSSKDTVVSKQELEEILAKYDFFKPV